MPSIVPGEAAPVDELRELRDHSSYAVERARATIVVAVLAGTPRTTVARILGHTRSMVWSTMKRYADCGVAGLRDGRRGRSSSPRMSEIVEALPIWTAKQPSEFGWPRSVWTEELLALHTGQELDIGVSRSHMGRLLKKAGCRRVKPKLTIALAPPDKEARMAALHAELRALPPEDVVMFEDEVDIHLNPKIGLDWAPAGMRKTLPTPGQNKKSYIAGAYDPATGLLLRRSGERKTSDLFIALLSFVAAHHAKAGRVHLVVDNYIIHRSKKTEKALKDMNGKVILHFLPPYSPEFNPIERVWWDLHACVTRNHRCADMAELCRLVDEFCDSYEQHRGRVTALRRVQRQTNVQ